MLMKRFLGGLLALLALGVGGCDRSTSGGRADAPHRNPNAPARPLAKGKAVAPAAASPRDDGQWTMPSKDYANTRFSELTQITKANVGKLQVALTFSSGTTQGQESAPIVVGSTLYFVTPYPNILYAIDLTKPGGAVKWKVNSMAASASQGEACCEGVNRGPTYANGTVYFNSLDSHTLAVDAETGKVKWKTQVWDYTKGETMTMAPFVVGTRSSSAIRAPNSARAAASRRSTRRRLDRVAAIATGPDKDVLIDPAVFKPFYPQYRGKDLGMHSWPGEAGRSAAAVPGAGSATIPSRI
jgi:glucose dehydrogenase